MALVFSFIPLAFQLFLLFKTHLEQAKAHSRLLFFFDLPLRFATPVLFIEPAYTSLAVKI